MSPRKKAAKVVPTTVVNKEVEKIKATAEVAKDAAVKEVLADGEITGPASQAASVTPIAVALAEKIDPIEAEMAQKLRSIRKFISDADFRQEKKERYQVISDGLVRGAVTIMKTCPPGDYRDNAIDTLNLVGFLACASIAEALKPTSQFPENPFPEAKETTI